ncbi:lysophospholipid acyltransferase family protein [Flavobacterium kingsejongi]|uniref:Lipid A biosynthesis acyltransferase n=1 Tax=Flavobacterium kingsejongi TaxID=1678728 RepID=A0A2S1LTM9_9FLAO|nr:lysophospholipid acyltransferase family protein [Flavobacterium kingsejongi]AWG27011.1 lipid A biosynthesis acyltransferase [Flavobacterium kingsejongi]
MQLFVFILVYPILWCISILPFRILYFFSDIIYFIVYHIVGYRKETVRENMAIALPHLTDEERKIVEQKFYHHFCDTFLEMIKTMTISEKEIKKRFVFDNLEIIEEIEAKGKSIILMCGHYASYEWLLLMNKYISFQGFGIYKRIYNKYFDRLVRRIRGKFDATLIDAKEAALKMKENQQKGILGYYGFISDQSPKLHRTNHYTKFFGVEVPVHTGAELLAKKLDMNIMFVKGEKVKRGYYKANFIKYIDEPKTIPNYQITDCFIKLLEQQIIEAPEYYLWTHKRFKHRRDPVTTQAS